VILLKNNMINSLKSILIFVVSVLILQSAKAEFPVTDASRIVHTMKVSAVANEMLYSMAYAMKPVCSNERADWMWSAGPYWASGNRALDKLRLWKGHGEAISTAFQLSEGEFVFVGDIDKLPWGYAGLKANEKFKFENRAEISNLTDPYMLMLQRKENDNTVVNAKDKALQNSPFNSFSMIRNGEKLLLNLRMSSVCKYGLDIIDSKYQYADSNDTLIIVTVPLLESLSKEELVVVLSHEIAHVALKLSKSRGRNKALAQFFIGSLSQINENQESGLSEPKVDDLIKADHLAMQLASGYGVDVSSYVGIIRKLVDRQDTFNAPTYRRTRGLSPTREQALRASVDLWQKSKNYQLVAGIDAGMQQEVRNRAKLVNANPESVFGSDRRNEVATNETVAKALSLDRAKAIESVSSIASKESKIIQTTPSLKENVSLASENEIKAEANKSIPIKDKSLDPASEKAIVGTIASHEIKAEPVKSSTINDKVLTTSVFAKLDDVDAVPYVTYACREHYRQWLIRKIPRAFAIGSSGRCGYSHRTIFSPSDSVNTHAQIAVQACERIGKDICKIYAVDDKVVWQNDTAITTSTRIINSKNEIAVAPDIANLKKLIEPKPIATGFAKIDDVDAIPYINDKARDKYREWLKSDTPRAFAISPTGAYASSLGLVPFRADLPTNPVDRAVKVCNEISKSQCKLYAVNGSVVWVQDESPNIDSKLNQKNVSLPAFPLNSTNSIPVKQ
jgi:Peptidase family M48